MRSRLSFNFRNVVHTQKRNGMPGINFGNSINKRIRNTLYALLSEGEAIQLTHSSFEELATKINDDESDNFKLTYPIGYRPDKTTMLGNTEYSKTDILNKLELLANDKLALNGIYQLVTIIEALLGDLVRMVIIKFPKKVGPKRNLKSNELLNCTSIEDLHIQIASSILNEMFYKSPKEFAEESKQFLSINLLECPSYHKYIEMKATRDIHIHNLGIVNDTYLIKASSHARAKLNENLPVNTYYYMECYEACLQLVEWIEKSIHEVWTSSEFEERQEKLKEKNIEGEGVQQ